MHIVHVCFIVQSPSEFCQFDITDGCLSLKCGAERLYMCYFNVDVYQNDTIYIFKI